MADVRVEMFPDAEEKMLAACKGEVSKLTADICAKANGLASETSGIWHIYGSPNAANPGNGTWNDRGKEFPTKGGTPAQYGYKPAKMVDGKPVGIVYTANYAAQKDNMKNNTLLKAR